MFNVKYTIFHRYFLVMWIIPIESRLLGKDSFTRKRTTTAYHTWSSRSSNQIGENDKAPWNDQIKGDIRWEGYSKTVTQTGWIIQINTCRNKYHNH